MDVDLGTDIDSFLKSIQMITHFYHYLDHYDFFWEGKICISTTIKSNKQGSWKKHKSRDANSAKAKKQKSKEVKKQKSREAKKQESRETEKTRTSQLGKEPGIQQNKRKKKQEFPKS